MFRFGDFELDPDTRRLLRRGEPMRLTPKAYELLHLLLDHRPKAIPKAAIRDRLWPATFVSESTLSSLVSELRTTLGDDARQPVFLRTVHAFGYAFCGEAHVGGPARAPAPVQCWHFVVYAGTELRLREGENVLGRDPDAAVQLESPSVSRAHAVIRVDASGAVLEDLASRNGTRVNGRIVTGPVRLSDGDRIDVAEEQLGFKTLARADLVETRPGPVEVSPPDDPARTDG